MVKVDEKKKKYSIAFHIAGSNAELLQNIHHLMAERGIVGLKDPAGKYHFIIDGRKGAPFAAKRIDDMARILLREQYEENEKEELNAEFYVDAVLECYCFQRTLKGYQYLRHILMNLILDPGLKGPLTKALYPLTARAFRISVSQIERNIRYCLDKLRERENGIEKDLQSEMTFCENGMGRHRVKRVLIQGRSHYGNSEAIDALELQIRQLIRRDRCEDEEGDSPEGE